MSPASIIHSLLQGEMAWLLRNQLKGHTFTELAIQTSDGVRVPEVAWDSKDFFSQHKNELFASSAPEICVEIISPSNTAEEMLEKTQLFIEAGAQEVWLVTESGDISFYNQEGQVDHSEFDIEIDKLTLDIL